MSKNRLYTPQEIQAFLKNTVIAHLAKDIGVSEYYLTKLKKGDMSVSAVAFQRVCEYMNKFNGGL